MQLKLRRSPATFSAHLLRAEEVAVHFEGVKAIDGVDLELRRGEVLGLIGPNGAGKTTLVNALSGFQRLTAGTVFLDEASSNGIPPDRLCRLGLCRTFQNVRLFSGLTAYENIELAATCAGYSRRDAAPIVWELLEHFGLPHTARRQASSLPHGEERRLGIARGLASRPAFFLLDEPAAGLNERESDELLSALRIIPSRFDVGLLVIEHDMRLIMRLCDRIQVIDRGRTIALGSPREVQSDPQVLAAYLGSRAVNTST